MPVETSRGATGRRMKSRRRLETQAGSDDYRQLADHDELERAFIGCPRTSGSPWS